MSIDTIQDAAMQIREGTTRYVNITCKSRETGNNFDFTGFTVQTYLSFNEHAQYVPTTIVENLVSYKIPAAISLGAQLGIAETRIFKDGDVYEVLRIRVSVKQAEKPDITPTE